MATLELSSSYDNPDHPVMGHSVCIGKTRIEVIFLFGCFDGGLTNTAIKKYWPSLEEYNIEILRKLFMECKNLKWSK